MNRPTILKCSMFILMMLTGMAGCSVAGPGGAKVHEPISKARAPSHDHPCLFFTMADVPRLRVAARTTHQVQFERLQTWGRLFGAFEPIAADKLPADRDTMQVYYENGASYVFNMSLLYQLTGDETSYRTAEKWLLAFASYPVETNGGYFIGAYALALASGYDMLYPRLDEETRAQIRAHLAAVLERGKTGTLHDWWMGRRLHHDHWLPAAGLCVGALALLDGTPEANERLAYFSDHMQRAMDAVGDDG